MSTRKRTTQSSWNVASQDKTHKGDAGLSAQLPAFLRSDAIRRLCEMVEREGFRLVVRGRMAAKGDPWALFAQEAREVLLHTMDEKGRPLPHDVLCFNLAHEVRHVIHYRRGLYRRYYENASPRPRSGSECRSYQSLVRDALTLAICPVAGLKAENDCNRWALAYVSRYLPASKGKRWQVDAYPMEGVVGYSEYCAREADRRSGASAQALALARSLDRLVQETSTQEGGAARRSSRVRELILKTSVVEAALGRGSLLHDAINDIKTALSDIQRRAA